MAADRLRWLYFRLRAMSAGEVAHRLVEFTKRRSDKNRTFNFGGPAVALPHIEGLRDRVRSASPEARAALRAAAQHVQAGRYHFLGQDWPRMEQGPAWHLDPVSKKLWPADRFCFAIPFRHTSDYGDVKYVWEINRLQHLQPVAAAAVCDDDPKLAALCVAQIRSWIDANPPFKGVNWASGIELALRVMSLSIVLSLLPKDALTDADRNAISETLRAHLYWLSRYPSRFSSANNHLVAEAAGLFMLGTLAPDLPDARRAAAHGRRVLNEEALRQIFADGAPAEQSPTYGAFTVEMMLIAHAAAVAGGAPGLAQGALNRFAAFAAFVQSLTDRNGNVPHIGDDDEGRVIAGEGDHDAYLASITASIAALAGAASSDGAIAGGASEALRAALLPAALPARSRASVTSFPDGGYTVLREEAKGDECLLVLDHGPLGYLSIAAHGHADALAIWLHVAGLPVLVDAGTYLYHAGADWRRSFRSTAAHNTLVIGGGDQSAQVGAFNWSAKANAKLVSLDRDSARFRAVAEHDGYLQQFGVVHRRDVQRAGPGRYIVEDTLVGNLAPSAEVEIGFLVAPSLIVEASETGWRIATAERPLLSIDCETTAKRMIQRGLSEPTKAGWVSPRFGVKEPATRLIATFAPNARTLRTTLTVRSA